jgi:hypothetical protein
LPDGEGRSLICIGGRGEIDDAAAVMLAQVMEIQGATIARAAHTALGLIQLRRLDLDQADTVILTYLNAASSAQARHAVRRLKRLNANCASGFSCRPLNQFRTSFPQSPSMPTLLRSPSPTRSRFCRRKAGRAARAAEAAVFAAHQIRQAAAAAA